MATEVHRLDVVVLGEIVAIVGGTFLSFFGTRDIDRFNDAKPQ